MGKRAIKGTGTDWQRYRVVLDIPEESTGIFFGILLDGKGQVWLSSVQFEEAPNELESNDEPGNLDVSEIFLEYASWLVSRNRRLVIAITDQLNNLN